VSAADAVRHLGWAALRWAAILLVLGAFAFAVDVLGVAAQDAAVAVLLALGIIGASMLLELADWFMRRRREQLGGRLNARMAAGAASGARSRPVALPERAAGHMHRGGGLRTPHAGEGRHRR
jgi:hypothetical protein